MGLPDDFKKQTTVTLSLLVWIAMVSFSMGMIYAKIVDNEQEHVALEDYIEQEVGGLRADWDRDRTEQNRRIELLEK